MKKAVLELRKTAYIFPVSAAITLKLLRTHKAAALVTGEFPSPGRSTAIPPQNESENLP